MTPPSRFLTWLLAAITGVVSAGAAATTHDGDWPAYGQSSDETHYSPLHQIDTGNIDRLGLAWYADLDPMISSFGAPLEVGGTLYAGLGLSVLYAFDAATGKLLWKYDPQVAPVAGEKLRSSHGTRGIAYWNGTLLAGTLDGRLISVDAATGKLRWSVQTTAGPNDGRIITGAPRVFGDKVIIGHGGADLAGVRGYVTAYAAATGRELWRFYTVPGDPAQEHDPVLRKAAATWHGDYWKFGGGGAVWNAITYDAELDRIYLGTGNGAPWNQKIRSPDGGDNLYVASIVALDAKTGRYRWHYQSNPGDTWDFDAAMDMALTTLKLGGRERKVLLQASKNGFFYVIDRTDGKLVSAQPFTKVTWASGIDLKTGRPIESPGARFDTGEGIAQPGATGAHGWQAMAYSPATQLAYIPATELPMHYDWHGIDPKTWAPTTHLQSNTGYHSFEGRDPPPIVPMTLGSLEAWDPKTQQLRWRIPLPAPYNGGVAATAGGLVFQGNAQGRFVAYDAASGKTAWSFDAQDGIIGQPISFALGGRQYVSVITGFTGIPAAMGPQVAQFGWDYRTQPRRVLTFALDAHVKLPAHTRFTAALPADDGTALDPKAVEHGAAVYGPRCFLCHGITAVAAGGAPDLVRSPVPRDAAAFKAVVHDGALVPRGMPQFAEFSDADLVGLRQYLLYRARQETAKP